MTTTPQIFFGWRVTGDLPPSPPQKKNQGDPPPPQISRTLYQYYAVLKRTILYRRTSFRYLKSWSMNMGSVASSVTVQPVIRVVDPRSIDAVQCSNRHDVRCLPLILRSFVGHVSFYPPLFRLDAFLFHFPSTFLLFDAKNFYK